MVRPPLAYHENVGFRRKDDPVSAFLRHACAMRSVSRQMKGFREYHSCWVFTHTTSRQLVVDSPFSKSVFRRRRPQRQTKCTIHSIIISQMSTRKIQFETASMVNNTGIAQVVVNAHLDIGNHRYSVLPTSLLPLFACRLPVFNQDVEPGKMLHCPILEQLVCTVRFFQLRLVTHAS